jgi:hypothetical protein
MQDMENPSLKARYDVPETESGVLVINVLPGGPAEDVLELGDVVTAIDEHDVENDGTVEFRPKQRTQLSYFVQQRQLGDPISLDILRGGQPQRVDVKLHRSLREDWLIQMEQYDVLPSYFIYGGVVFCPLSKNLLKEWGANWYNAAPKELVALLGANFRTQERDEVVIVLKVLAADVNEGYHNVSNWVVEKANGTVVRNLQQLVKVVEEARTPFVEFASPTGQQLVLDRVEVEASASDVLALYRIDADRSPDLPDRPTPDVSEP